MRFSYLYAIIQFLSPKNTPSFYTFVIHCKTDYYTNIKGETQREKKRRHGKK
jgi:hypothetical protein